MTSEFPTGLLSLGRDFEYFLERLGKPLSYINRIRLQTSLVDKWGKNQRIICHITLHTNCVALKTICVVEKPHHLL